MFAFNYCVYYVLYVKPKWNFTFSSIIKRRYCGLLKTTNEQTIKRNAQKVPTTLGGGQNGYLGLVVAPEAYNTIPGTRPFERPDDPGPFTSTTRRVARVTTRWQAVF